MKTFHLMGPAPYYTNSFVLCSEAGNALAVDPVDAVGRRQRRQRPARRALRHNYTMGRQNVKPGDVGQHRLQQPRLVRGVQQDDVELLPHPLEIFHRVTGHHLGPVGKLRHLQVLSDQLHRVGPAVHKGGPGGATAEGLDAQLAGAGEEVQHPPPLQVKL